MKTLIMAVALMAIAVPAGAVTVTRADYGVTAKGEKVSAFTLKNRRGMQVKLLDYGGIITEILTPDAAGKRVNVALDLGSLKAYEGRANFSSLIGRFANRISGGGFTLDGVRYDLASSPDGISAHGGPGSFSTKVWAATPFKGRDKAGVCLRYVSVDGENGFPGTLTTRVCFTLDEQNALTLDYRAVTDKPTVVNLTHHVYFNLAGEENVADQTLSVAASRFLSLDAKRMVTGDYVDVAGTPFDLRKAHPIGVALNSTDPQAVIGRGYDHNFVLDKPEGAFAEVAILRDPASGRVLSVSTSAPGLQVYNAGGFNGSLIDAKGRPLEKAAGVALEAQGFPNSPNIAAFPSTTLRPGETYRQRTRYAFSVTRGQ